MEILLRREVDRLGKAGDLVDVKPGYARNYLLPRGLAMVVSKENARLIESERDTLVKEEEVRVQGLQDMAAKLDGASVTIADKASPEGHLYGSVNAARIAEALHAQGFDVTAKMVLLDEPIKELNVYDVSVRLHSGVETTCKVWVVSDNPDEASVKTPASGPEAPADEPEADAAEAEDEPGSE